MANLKLTVLEPDRKLVEEIEVSDVTLPTSEGEVQLLPEHSNLLGTLDAGVFSYTPLSGAEPLKNRGAISGGFYEITDGRVNVMAETLELSDEIDVDRAKAAEQKAASELESATEGFEAHQRRLRKAQVRQQAAGK